MQLAGREKKIQALFCELSHADQSITPRFEKLWNRAQTTNPVRSFSRSVAIIAAGVAVAVVCSLALWPRFKSAETAPSTAVGKTESISTPLEQKILVANNPKKQKRVTRQRKSRPVVTSEPITLSRWQSPTAILMESSNALLKMPPQLDQSMRELESFLPTEVKETKQ